MNRLKTGIFSLVGIIILVISCTKEYPGIEELDTQLVQEYIQKNNLTMQQYGQTGIYYQVVRQGTGPALAFNRETPFIYTVKSLDGSYSSLDTFAFSNRFYNFFGYLKPDSLRQVLKQAGANQGGIVRVILPSRFAYGKKGSGSIPGNASLDYSITALTADQIANYDDLAITKYLASQNLTGFSKSVNGVYYKIAEVGDGSAVISDESTISVQYTGRFLTGKIFEQSASGTSFTRLLGDLIKGWREVLPLIKKGGSVRVIIPSSLAYGMSGNQAIPPFSCLDFDIKVTDVAN
jgi:FKBP-type peptidyl-prolyl cis-trans isomerase